MSKPSYFFSIQKDQFSDIMRKSIKKFYATFEDSVIFLEKRQI